MSSDCDVSSAEAKSLLPLIYNLPLNETSFGTIDNKGHLLSRGNIKSDAMVK